MSGGTFPDSSTVPSFFSNILTPGSSLHPTFLLLVDGAFAMLLLVLISLAVITRGNVHFFALMMIEVALWASVKWFVNELQKVQAQEPLKDSSTDVDGYTPKSKDD